VFRRVPGLVRAAPFPWLARANPERTWRVQHGCTLRFPNEPPSTGRRWKGSLRRGRRPVRCSRPMGGCLPGAHGARVRRVGGQGAITDGPAIEGAACEPRPPPSRVEGEETIERGPSLRAVVGGGVSELRPVYQASAFATEQSPALRPPPPRLSFRGLGSHDSSRRSGTRWLSEARSSSTPPRISASARRPKAAYPAVTSCPGRCATAACERRSALRTPAAWCRAATGSSGSRATATATARQSHATPSSWPTGSTP